MNNSTLPWNKINEKDFEYLIRALAEMRIANANWNLYLKKGHKQEGIDIYCLDIVTQKYVCIQCKFYRDMNISTLENCLTAFEEGTFFNTTKKFIIATTADLQKKKELRDYFDRQVGRFFNYSIELELWDLENIEEQLRFHYGLVLKHFGRYAANDHCYSKNRHKILTYPPVENYLERSISKVNDFEVDNEFRFYFGKREALELSKIFLADYVTTHRICIIGDAYQGKSTILEQLAHKLSETGIYLPILIRIKSHSVKPISSILDESYSYWNEYPTKELVIILDGLDEVAKDKFSEFEKLIGEFSTSFPAIKIVFSCRKFFFSHYKVHENIVGFEFYELLPITESQIEEYLKKLRAKKRAFKRYIAEYHLTDLLYHPFYLVKLVDMYIKSTDSSTLPKNKKEILNYLIGESFTRSEKRPLSGGILFAEEKNNYIKCIKKMALGCQMLGVNALASSYVEEIFDRTQLELLTHSSFLTKQNNLWAFDIAFFQENLAAMALMDIPYDKVLKIVTVGSFYKKLKTKWIQTIASYVSLLDADDKRKINLLDLIDKDNNELLTFCDASKFPQLFRLTVLKKIIEKCIETNSFPQLARIDIVASFIKDCDDAITYLLDIADSDCTLLIKNLSWKILYNFDDLHGLDDAVKKIIIATLAKTEDGTLASLLLNMLSKFKLVKEGDIENLTNHDRLKLATEYLDGLFDLLIDYKLVDKYYSIGLDSIEIFEKHQLLQSQYGSQRTLEKFLLSTDSPKNVYRLLTQISIKQWSLVYGDSYLNDDKDQLMLSLCDIAVKAHKHESMVLIPVTVIMTHQLRRHYNNEHVALFKFFERTGTSWLLFRLCFQAFPSHDLTALVYMLNAECFPYIFNEFEEGRINQYCLEELYSLLKFWKKDEDLSEAFYQDLIAVAPSKFREDQERRNWERWELEKIKYANDVKIIQSQSTFVEGVKVFFQAYGQNTIPRRETFVGNSPNMKRRRADSTFLSNFFLRFETEQITFKQCIEKVNQTDWFEYFQAQEIARYNFPSDESKTALIPILKRYYDAEIQKTDFRNSIKQYGNTYRASNKPDLLKSVFEKYRFNTPEKYLVQMLWLIRDGFNHLKQSSFYSQRNDSLSGLILETIDSDIIIENVMSNIKLGIEADFVLSSHLEFCRHLKIFEVTDLILQADIFDRFADHEKSYLIDIYLELGGDKAKLLKLFNSIQSTYKENEYLFVELSQVLIGEFTDHICNSLALMLNESTIDNNKKVKYAIMLINAGRPVGFAFLVSNVMASCEALDRFQGNYTLREIPTSFALGELSKIRNHILDEDLPFHAKEFFSTKDFIIHNVYQLAKKSESDLSLVELFLMELYHQYKSHSNSSQILFHVSRVLEIFRESDETVFQIHELKNFLSIEFSH